MAKICLSLTGRTLDENLAAVEMYREYIDLVELRADRLDAEELFNLRSFPEKVDFPVILCIRRHCDGGGFDGGEGVRLVTMAKGLAFADTDTRRNYAYIEVEHDFQISALQEAARTFGTKVIRVYLALDGVPEDLGAVWSMITQDPFEIPKLVVRPKGIAEVTRLYDFFRDMPRSERIVSAMGDYGFCTRLLVERTGSSMLYASGTGAGLEPGSPGQADPDVLVSMYRLHEVDKGYALFGIVGGPSVLGSMSPRIHNTGFAAMDFHGLYIPFPVDDLEDFFELADAIELRGFSVTVPYKERILPFLSGKSPEVDAIGACNTAIRMPGGWMGHNTDAYGFKRALLKFLDTEDIRGLPVTIIGAGGAARAVAFALHELGARACVINRNMLKAKRLAETYGFPWSGLSERALDLVMEHNGVIVQATHLGMEGSAAGDPLDWYEFAGTESVFETIYNPAQTQFLKRAAESGCRVTNGMAMLREQAAVQFKLFTGQEYPGG